MSNDLILISHCIPQVLVAAQLPASETAQYTCPASTTVSVTSATLTNTTGSAVVAQLSLVKNGGSAGAANRTVYVSVASNTSVNLPGLVGASLQPGDFISGLAASASSVAFCLSALVAS